ncbi:MAG: hypothetical protein ABI700_33400, partial [Chloroflexota bacterium]
MDHAGLDAGRSIKVTPDSDRWEILPWMWMSETITSFLTTHSLSLLILICAGAAKGQNGVSRSYVFVCRKCEFVTTSEKENVKLPNEAVVSV